jgi:hypothetical protein
MRGFRGRSLDRRVDRREAHSSIAWRLAGCADLIAIGLPLVLQLASIFINLIFSAQDLD